MKTRYRIILICGIIMIVLGFGLNALITKVLYHPTEPPYMSPVSDPEIIFFSLRYYFLYTGMAGISVLIAGSILEFFRR